MPIRFRCAYCNQLMAIATRKAATVVRCPTCAGQVVVPQPSKNEVKQPLESPPAAGAVFDRPDFEQKLQGAAPSTGAHATNGQGGIDVEPVPMAPLGVPEAITQGLPEQAGFYMTPGRLTILTVMVLVLLGLAFFGGMLMGKG